ncbi:glycoside hydrolase family 16 protein [Sediminicola sp. YIK13]|uniref:glycoside hydrolase family 16 protein n=1 Tax=Sediminicola sp. YIK13 TaxID=1453352 RepID=UPI0009E923DE|nr:glycoside hydrolase family 16 protein [Sediminicola sp. YIK13]
MISGIYSRIMLIGGLMLFFLTSCSSGDAAAEPIEEDVVPTNLNLTVNIVGADANNPNGDGSGMIQCTATATNAVRYGFKIGNQEEQESVNGVFDYKFTASGESSHVISVFAYSSTNDVISTFKTITVYVLDETGLVWSDEFDSEGAVLSSNWFSEEVPPVNGGWYNGEQQHYTARTDNAYVSNGTLKIVAKKENYTAYNSTKSYTSARLNSKFAFTYGRIEVRAKLPSGGGTWPAIWTLGSNISTVDWPSCGEIDIMEHVGNNIGEVSSAIHTPSSFGNTVNKGIIEIPDTTTEFHVYAVDWTADKMDFYVDDTLFYTYNPASKNSDTWPFNKDQFILLNIAMGGTLGGSIDPNFTQGTMEIDYVRVYQ